MRSVTWMNQAASAANSESSRRSRYPLQQQFTSPAANSVPVSSGIAPSASHPQQVTSSLSVAALPRTFRRESFVEGDDNLQQQRMFYRRMQDIADTYHAIDPEESFSNASLDRTTARSSSNSAATDPRTSAHFPRSKTYPKSTPDGISSTSARQRKRPADLQLSSTSVKSTLLKGHPQEVSFGEEGDDETSFLQDLPSNIRANKAALLADAPSNAARLSLDGILSEENFSPPPGDAAPNTGLDLTSRLVHAIESLRKSVHDNTHAQHGSSTTAAPASRTKSNSRAKSKRANSQMTCKAGGAQNKNDENVRVKNEKATVEVRVVFLKIGEIDTLKEYYHADVFTQAKWKEPKLNNFSTEELSKVDLDKFWSPLLYIDNILSETKEAQWLTAQHAENGEVYLVERRRIRGVFLETLELNDFPLDVQDLTVTITTERSDIEVDLVPDQREMSAINNQTFVDQQEWRLHHHVEITKRIMTQEYSSSMRSQPCISVTCRAARRPGYFYWNVFLIMFMISGLSFATFSVTPDKVEHRLRLSFTLVLTSVTFKYVITQSLPKISYLTYMDKYVLMSLAILCVVSIWHAFVTVIPTLLSGGEQAMLPILGLNSSRANTTVLVNPAYRGSGSGNLPDTGSLSTLSPADPSAFVSSSPFLAKSSTSAPSTTPTSQQKLGALWQLFERWRGGSNKLDAEGYLMEEEGEDDGGGGEMSAEELEVVKDIEKTVFTCFLAFYAMFHVVFGVWLYFGASKRRREMIQKDADYKAFLARNREWQRTQAVRDSNSAARRRQSSIMVNALVL